MEIIKVEKKHLDEVTEIAYDMYQSECNYVTDVTKNDKEHLHKKMETAMDELQGYVYVEQGEVQGYLLYDVYEKEDNETCCFTPLWGYGASGNQREKILSRLFQKVAQDLCIKGAVHFEIKLYAHDESIIRLFSFLQFGIQSEEGICSVNQEIMVTDITEIQELSKAEIKKRWSDIWSLLSCLIHHLQESPVFYPGDEFTEEVYKDFFLDGNTQVYVAMKNERMIGLIEANGEQNGFIGKDDLSRNVGEAYVLDEYRGQGIAQALLEYVRESSKVQGVKYLWVEHGTANPNARGFWNKYFKTYCYSMIRDIRK